MTETDHEILEHLVHIRSALDAMCEDMRELKRPLGALENRYLSMSCQLDGINSRIERIERRLDLTDA
jgi:predicted  nucleic acid-binding Zn-ribbon protein